MKKLVILLAMVMLSGCVSIQRPSEGWLKEGASIDQLKRDYSECRGTLYLKDGMTYEEYEKDWTFCTDLSIARYNRGADLLWASSTASSIIIYSSRDLCQRCMESKGYRKNDPRSENDINSCMQEKGYEWK